MALFVAAPAVETTITNMPESGLIVLSIGAVLLAGFLLIPVMLAGRAPRRPEPASTPPWTGPVQGGVHLGDARSVAPHRDTPAEPFDAPHRDAPAEPFDQEKLAQAQAAGDQGPSTDAG